MINEVISLFGLEKTKTEVRTGKRKYNFRRMSKRNTIEFKRKILWEPEGKRPVAVEKKTQICTPAGRKARALREFFQCGCNVKCFFLYKIPIKLD